MAVVTQTINETLVRHFSDTGMLIRQAETGVLYGEAVDAVPCRYAYEETTTPADTDATEAEYLGYLRRLGVDVDG